MASTVIVFLLCQACSNTLRATSRGTVTLKSADPYEHPIIDPNYLDTADDVRDLRTSAKLTRQVTVCAFVFHIFCIQITCE